jgi:bifunctional UDP-N-acetylglucosamine pyrophosphorylase/glucosamine-1-phosphate N-acetyltransferase
MSKTKAIILAAGFGTRMKSKHPKVIHDILGRPLVSCVIQSARDAGVDEICVVVGHASDDVKAAIKEEVSFVMQSEQLGTGHAVMMAADFIEEEGKTLVLFGDTPLISSETLKELLETTITNDNAVTVLSTVVDEPFGYGRIIRKDGQFSKSVEHKDATKEETDSNSKKDE